MKNLKVLALLHFMLLGSICSLALGQALQLHGEIIQGAVLIGKLPAGQSVFLKGQQLPVSADRQFVLGLDRDHGNELLLRVVSDQGLEQEHRFTVANRDYNIQRIEGIVRKIMNPNIEDLERIRRESRQVKAARAEISSREDFLQSFVWPIEGRITGVYGSQRVYNGVAGRPHYGVDVAAPVGAEVTAPAAGRIVLAHKNMFYSGGTLIIDHGHGLTSSFLHLSKILVVVGQEVQGGERVAEVGATGRVTGPHLDWRMNWRDARVDPELLVPEMPLKSAGE